MHTPKEEIHSAEKTHTQKQTTYMMKKNARWWHNFDGYLANVTKLMNPLLTEFRVDTAEIRIDHVHNRADTPAKSHGETSYLQFTIWLRYLQQ